jgi:hypothetical protein
VSEPLAYNFLGNLQELVLNVDSSIQLIRENFLLVEHLDHLTLNFECRKTSRELKELFNLLPRPRVLKLSFDYKQHSHLSCEGFPLLSKAAQVPEEQLHLQVTNARPELLEDLMEAARLITPKTSLWIEVGVNAHIEES